MANRKSNSVFQVIKTLRDHTLRWYMQTPEHPTKYRMVRWLGRNCFPHEGIKTRVPPEVKLYLHPRDWMEYWLLSKRDYEPLTLEFIARNLKPGQKAVFAGVNFGLHVIVAARAVGESGKIIGVEPQPSALLRARMNIELNGVSDRVELISAALGPDERFVHMAWSKTEENAGAASLLDEGKGLTVRLLPISQVLDVLMFDAVQLFLLDVEGYEVNVLKGLTSECIPKIIIVEVQPEFLERANSSEEELLNMLRTHGYKLYTLTGTPVTTAGMEIPERNLVGVNDEKEPHWAGSV
jgi:FkbM family methyltransferase